MNNIYTLKDNDLISIPSQSYLDTTNNAGYCQELSASHLYIKEFDEANYMIIDSFFDLVDIVPKRYLEVKKDKIILDSKLSFQFFHERYSNVNSAEGIAAIKARYDKQLEEDIKNKKLAVFTLCPTYSCNMMCTYCYQKNYDRKYETISSEKLDEILAIIKNEIMDIRTNNPSEKILLELFGGEPLQMKNKDIVIKFFTFAREMKCKVNIVTNGYQMFDFALILSKYKDVVSELCTTIDGVKDFHNSRRLVAAEEGSFDKIAKGIDLLLKLGFKISVASNIDAQNIDHIGDFIQEIKDQGWPEYEGFSVRFGRVYDRLQANKYDNVIFESRILKAILEVFKDETSIPDWVNVAFLKSTERLAKMVHVSLLHHEYGKALFHYCWSTSPILDGYYVDYRGMAYRCTTTVANDNFTLGNINEITRDTYNASKWKNRSLFHFDKCLHCEIGGFCSGGCPLEQKTYNELTCENEKENFNDFIENLFKPILLGKMRS